MLGNVVMRSRPQAARAAAGAHGGTSTGKVSAKGKAPKLPVAHKKFPAGVMAGDAEPDRAVLWTKYTGEELSAHLREAQPQPGRKRPFRRINERDIKKKGPFVHVDVKGLSSGVRYEYEFRERSGGKAVARSPRGYFCTALDPDAEGVPVEFGGISCTNQFNRQLGGGKVDKRLRRTNRNLLGAAMRSDLAFFLHGGDQLYCDAPINGGPATSLGDYRRIYQKAFSRRGLETLHRSFGMYTTWDDHEVFNDWQGAHDTKELRSELKIRAAIEKKDIKKVMKAGVQSFFDHQPIREDRPAGGRPSAGNPPVLAHLPGCPYKPGDEAPQGARSRKDKKLWSSFRWGRTLELFILDGRSERRRGEGRYLSKKQMKWLVHALHHSQAVFKFILNAAPITHFRKAGKDKDKDEGKGKGKRKKDLRDRWVASEFKTQRERILSAAECVGGVCWLSGDLHFGFVGGVDPDQHQSLCEVLMGPGGSKKSTFPRKLRKLESNLSLEWNTFATSRNNYVVIRANPAPIKEDSTIEIRFFDGSEQFYYEKRGYKMNVLEQRPNLQSAAAEKKK